MKESRPTLSLVMIVCDEEESIARPLRSAIGVVDEAIVVDTGSVDGTKQIATTFAEQFPGIDGGPGLRLLDFEWCQDFAAARNFALDAAFGDWALHLDADEELLHGQRDVPGLISATEYDGYFAHIVDAPSISALDEAIDEYVRLRLFRNRDDLRYTAPIHEHLPLGDMSRFVECTVDIVHFGYFLARPKDRFARNVPLLESAILGYPERLEYRYMLGKEYLWAGDSAAAWGSFSLALNAYREASQSIPPYLYRDAAASARLAGDLEAAEAVLSEGRAAFPDFVDLELQAGYSRLEAGDAVGARSCFERCLRLGDNTDERFRPTIGAGGRLAQEALEKCSNLTS